ncbi:MAG: sulfite oxidase, partial [Gemmatimonadaceae bacterium]|jgi:sulfite oxidase|nr:sulfite oxidase [Gemmatimonadaceae bacterium]
MLDSAGRRVYDADGLNVGSLAPTGAGITPTRAFFLRSHAPPPAIDAATFHLDVDGMVQRATAFSLAELLTRFALHEVTATLVCAGMRRVEFSALGSLNGELPWGADPVSTGVWSGVRLADVLRDVGVEEGATHVEFSGLDAVERDGERFGFGGSIALTKALTDDVLLATHLNGAPLPVAHGYPLRAVVPGWIGARSVKWLGRITVTDRESRNYFQAKAYRVQREADPTDPRDVRRGAAMDVIPRNAVIVSPPADARVSAGAVRVAGWAIGAGARPIERVEVRVGDGDWVTATVHAPVSVWSWCWWEATVSLSPGRHTLQARAGDAEGVMPESLAQAWNVKGYGNNVWARTEVEAG